MHCTHIHVLETETSILLMIFVIPILSVYTEIDLSITQKWIHVSMLYIVLSLLLHHVNVNHAT